MDIKLRARLSAYAKIESLSQLQTNLPDPDSMAAGYMLGVNNQGTYTLFPTVTAPEIDELFEDIPAIKPEYETATKEHIDELFPEQSLNDSAVTKSDINTLFDNESTNENKVVVGKEDIDSLFETTDSVIVEAVDKDTIDTLFNKDSENSDSGNTVTKTVTFAEIDSLFE